MFSKIKSFVRKLKKVLLEDEIPDVYKTLFNVFKSTAPLNKVETDALEESLTTLYGDPLYVKRYMQTFLGANRVKKECYRPIAPVPNDVSYVVNGHIVYGNVPAELEEQYFSERNMKYVLYQEPAPPNARRIPLPPKHSDIKEPITDELIKRNPIVQTINTDGSNGRLVCMKCYEKKVRMDVAKENEMVKFEKELERKERQKNASFRTMNMLSELNEKLGMPTVIAKSIIDSEFDPEDLEDSEKELYYEWLETRGKKTKSRNKNLSNPFKEEADKEIEKKAMVPKAEEKPEAKVVPKPLDSKKELGFDRSMKTVIPRPGERRGSIFKKLEEEQQKRKEAKRLENENKKALVAEELKINCTPVKGIFNNKAVTNEEAVEQKELKLDFTPVKGIFNNKAVNSGEIKTDESSGAEDKSVNDKPTVNLSNPFAQPINNNSVKPVSDKPKVNLSNPFAQPINQQNQFKQLEINKTNPFSQPMINCNPQPVTNSNGEQLPVTDSWGFIKREVIPFDESQIPKLGLFDQAKGLQPLDVVQSKRRLGGSLDENSSIRKVAEEKQEIVVPNPFANENPFIVENAPPKRARRKGRDFEGRLF